MYGIVRSQYKGVICMTSTTTIHLDNKLKKLQKRIPFEILTEPEIPNKTTQEAMDLADAKDEGSIPDDSPEFDNVDDLMKSLDKNDDL